MRQGWIRTWCARGISGLARGRRDLWRTSVVSTTMPQNSGIGPSLQLDLGAKGPLESNTTPVAAGGWAAFRCRKAPVLLDAVNGG